MWPGVALGVFVLVVWNFIDVARSAWAARYAFSDLAGYQAGAQRFLDTGSPYADWQVSGPWSLVTNTFIHPPTALPLFVPFLYLPAVLWWIIPIGLTAYVLVAARLPAWAWVLVGLALLWPRSAGSVIAGNSDLWAMAFVAAGVRWGWPAALLAVKPTFGFLALVGIRRRSFWLAVLAVGAFSLLTLPLWLEYRTVIANVGLAPTYSLLNLPLVVIPLVAWLARYPRDGPRAAGY